MRGETHEPLPPLPCITVPRFLSKAGEWMETVAVLCKTPTSSFPTERHAQGTAKGQEKQKKQKKQTKKQTDGESSIPRATMPKSDGWLSTVAAIVPPIGHFHTLFLTTLEELLSRLGLKLMSHSVFEISEQNVEKDLKFVKKTLISSDVPLSRHFWKVRRLNFLKKDRWNWYPAHSLIKRPDSCTRTVLLQFKW